MEKRPKNLVQTNPAFQQSAPYYKNLAYWAKNYGQGGNMPDQKAIEVFIECETAELVKSLRAELLGVSRGNFRQDFMDATVGKPRALKHGSYQAWAKLALQWMAKSNG